jgi:hypothetical protein
MVTNPKIVHCTNDFKGEIASGSGTKTFENHLIRVTSRPLPLLR